MPNVSYCVNENEVHYNPYVEPIKTIVVTKYNVTSTSSPTNIGYNRYISGFSSIEIDGVTLPRVVSTYKFSTTGEHIIKYTLTDPTSIGNQAFYDCSSLTSINIPSGVTSIGNGAFSNCSGLTSIDVPSDVTIISDNLFEYCSGLTSVTMGSNVTSIGSSAFRYCSSLTSIAIQSEVTSIDSSAFEGCSSLDSIYVYPSDPPYLGSSAFSDTNDCPIYVSDVETYASADGWSEYEDRLQQ